MILLLLLIFILLSGCKMGRNNDQITAKKVSELITEDTLKYILKKDRNNLYKLFCKKAVLECNLQEEIQHFFIFINGNIVNYDKPSCNISTTIKENGEIIYQKLQGFIENIKDDNNNSYNITINYTYIYSECKEYEGLNSIIITNMNKEYELKIGI